MLFTAIFVALSAMSFTPSPPGKIARVEECGFTSLYNAGIWAGHQEFQLQQQGYTSFSLWTWCADDMCNQFCIRVYYSNAAAKDEITGKYKLKYRPADGETLEQLRQRAEKLE